MIRLIGVLGLAANMAVRAEAGTVLYVDANATHPDPNGSTWCTAFVNLQDALDSANASTEIRVAEGVYRPDRGWNHTPGDRDASFELRNGVVIKGGYGGCGAVAPDHRDLNKYLAILSGDLNGNDGSEFQNYGENSYRVLVGIGVGPAAVLDGFTIVGGNANRTALPFPRTLGGGLYLADANAIVTNCSFRANRAYDGGGAIGNVHSAPLFVNCMFLGNASVSPIGGGGAMYNGSGSNPALVNCTVSANLSSAFSGGDGVFNRSDSGCQVLNSILWGNGDSQFPTMGEQIVGGSSVIGFSCIEGWDFPDEPGNISDDPRFIFAIGSDGVPGTNDDNLRISRHSPCANAGDAAALPPDAWDMDADGDTTEHIPVDIAGQARVVDGTVDMGAYESRAFGILHVNETANGSLGTSWPEAFRDLNVALSAAGPGDQIWVAQGTYTPNTRTQVFDARSVTFELKPGIEVYGGFPRGGGNGTFEARAPAMFTTVLSGDRNGDDDTGGDPSENAYHVVTCLGANGSRLDGVTISGGNANGSFDTQGGGLHITDSDLRVVDCMFRNNSAKLGGGGMYIRRGSPYLSNCLFLENSALGSPASGGAIYGKDSTFTTVNCLFNGNTANFSGGAVYNSVGAIRLANCTLAHNRVLASSGTGGGVYNTGAVGTTLSNCILWHNYGGGFTEQSNQLGGAVVAVDYCCVQGWNGSLGGIGNFGDDPQFVYEDGPDNTPGTEDDNLRVGSASRCIDAGDNERLPPDVADLDGDGNLCEAVAVEFGGYARLQDDPGTPDRGHGSPPIVDIGAFEVGTAESELAGDMNGDGTRNLDDFAGWNACMPQRITEACSVFDFDCDDGIDLRDFATFQLEFTAP